MKLILNYLKKVHKTNDIDKEKVYFWNLGKQLQNYNSSNLEQLSCYLQLTFGNIVLVAKRNLVLIQNFYLEYSSEPNLIKENPNVTWYQHKLILESKYKKEIKLKLIQECNFYRWSTKELKQKIKIFNEK